MRPAHPWTTWSGPCARGPDGRRVRFDAASAERVVTSDEVPLILRQATLAAEDKSFFTHSGVDYRARRITHSAQLMLRRFVQHFLYSLPHGFLHRFLDGLFHLFRIQAGASLLRYHVVDRFLHEGIQRR